MVAALVPVKVALQCVEKVEMIHLVTETPALDLVQTILLVKNNKDL